MTLDEAIINCEEVADRCEVHRAKLPTLLAYVEKHYDAQKCAEEHRQLAEWLKELKRYKELFESPEEAEECLNGYMV